MMCRFLLECVATHGGPVSHVSDRLADGSPSLASVIELPSSCLHGGCVGHWLFAILAEGCRLLAHRRPRPPYQLHEEHNLYLLVDDRYRSRVCVNTSLRADALCNSTRCNLFLKPKRVSKQTLCWCCFFLVGFKETVDHFVDESRSPPSDRISPRT